MSGTGRWAAAYAALREREGRGSRAEARALPYVAAGPLAAQWAIRARTYDRFVSTVVAPRARRLRRPLWVLDLGAGNGWLCRRLAAAGHVTLAVDLRVDAVDGLAAAQGVRLRVAASFEALPLRAGLFEVVVYNASLHYAVNLERALAEAARAVAPGGAVAVLDSPFYAREVDGAAMLAERDAATRAAYPDLADDLASVRSVEFLTQERLERAAGALRFRRRRVFYPLSYEVRPIAAQVAGKRPPSRFDLWVAETP